MDVDMSTNIRTWLFSVNWRGPLKGFRALLKGFGADIRQA